MPPTKTWKNMERNVAKVFGGKRVICSGIMGEGDVEHKDFYIECKYSKVFRHHTIFRKYDEICKKRNKKYGEEKMPVLVTKLKSERGELITLKLTDFMKIYKKSVRC